ncbi:hypothetical protein, partial [Prevotella pectinovora]
LPPASFRFHLTMNTLAFGYVIPAIKAYSGLAPVRQCSCRAYNIKGAISKKNIDMTPFNYILLDRNDNSCLQQTDR